MTPPQNQSAPQAPQPRKAEQGRPPRAVSPKQPQGTAPARAPTATAPTGSSFLRHTSHSPNAPERLPLHKGKIPDPLPPTRPRCETLRPPPHRSPPGAVLQERSGRPSTAAPAPQAAPHAQRDPPGRGRDPPSRRDLPNPGPSPTWRGRRRSSSALPGSSPTAAASPRPALSSQSEAALTSGYVPPTSHFRPAA